MGRLIELEGIDGAGKTTLAKNLVQHYKATGYNPTYIKFPDEGHTEIGALIRSWLGKKWTTGDDRRDAIVHQCLQIVNRLHHLPPREDWGNSDIYIVDRYIGSSLIYGELDGINRAWLQYLQRHLPQPDITLILEITAEESFKRRPGRSDRYEENRAYMDGVEEAYKSLDFDRPVAHIDTTDMTKEQTLCAAVELIWPVLIA